MAAVAEPEADSDSHESATEEPADDDEDDDEPGTGEAATWWFGEEEAESGRCDGEEDEASSESESIP